MLITTFAAGELSENLFGRVDIQQYYQGAARLENFDVIPTGGIKRRGGTERLLALDGEGRLIPFSVDRQDHFLLYLTPGRIQVIRNGSIHNTLSGVYDSLAEIKEIHYVQNFNRMVLTHENYPPQMVQYGGGNFTVSALPVRRDVEIEASEGIDTGSYAEQDKTYAEKNYLSGPGNYPRTATFFNGRLLLAGTAKDPQRIFASKSGDIHSFATYKKFLTENRKYVTVLCKTTPESNIIALQNPPDLLQFTEAVTQYETGAPYFPDGTKVTGLEGTNFIVSQPPRNILPLTNEEEREIDALIEEFDNLNANKTGPFEIAFSRMSTTYVYIGSSDIDIAHSISTSDAEAGRETRRLPSHAAGMTQAEIRNWIKKETITDPYTTIIDSGFSAAVAQVYQNVQKTMRFNFRETDYYDYAPTIRERIIMEAGGGTAYISFFNRKIIEDKYPTPDDGFTFEIASDMADAIRWIIMNKGVIIGTETAEWIIPPEATAASLYAVLNSRYGSDRIQGAAVDDAVCFFQAGKKALAEYYIPQQDTNFRVNNMAMMSPAMLAESPAVEFDFIRAPYTKLFIIREDGTAVTLLYERSTGTFAWGRFTTAGRIISVAMLPGADGNDDMYLLVRRGGGCFLEVLRESCGVYLDSFECQTGAGQPYTDEAVVHDGMIGYPYTSLMRSMPVVANDKMKPSNIGNLYIRFADSYIPRLRLPGGAEQPVAAREEPYSGVAQAYFPGGHDRTLLFELFHDRPSRCRILAIYAEAN